MQSRCRVSLFAFLLWLSLFKCESRDIITAVDSLSNKGEHLVSAGKVFELGFFTKDGGSNTYAGIWYKESPETVVWVANRDKPIQMFDDVLVIAIDDNGNLGVLDSSRKSYFSTEVASSSSSNKRTAKLLDSGNLVLTDDLSGKRQWQSFDNPTDTFLPGMRMDEGLKLTSWKMSLKDPGYGNYTFELDNLKYKVLQRSVLHWKGSATANQFSFNEIPSIVSSLLSNYRLKSSGQSNSSVRFNSSVYQLNHSRLLMNSSGEIQFYTWDKRWFLSWFAPDGPCGTYDTCGEFGICNDNNKSLCKCLPGFKPASLDDWLAGKLTNGCLRKSVTACQKRSELDTFLNMSSMKFDEPDQQYSDVKSEDDCKRECLDNCDCRAYSYRQEDGQARRGGSSTGSSPQCSIWTSDIRNLQEDYPGGFNISILVAKPDIVIGAVSEAEKAASSNRKALVLSISLTAGIITMCCIGYLIYHRKKVARRKEAMEIILENRMEYFPESGSSCKYSINEDDKKRIDVPFFNLESILVATDNFSETNKLGRGGFGPVYKGKFPQGKEMAVKRLSSHSSQGAEEFKNEVMLIAKLQHRNLVRLLGYCIEANEKILLYEYMPNKSLDTFIFDHNLRQLLDWKIRFDIILGIARGLLYLHHDSRLRIIHRDLKTSNILLDEEMNAKISDFGLARIVEGKSIEANTEKIVGTYGYLSPEYALEGLFSIKSDVFAFGVVVLEIISGKKNLQTFQETNLLGYAWNLWTEDKAFEMMDPVLVDTCNKNEALKCINVALLCVQEHSGDRPTMSNVVVMLASEGMALPTPNQPAFISRRNTASTSSSSSYKPYTVSNNELTITTIAEGR